MSAIFNGNLEEEVDVEKPARHLIKENEDKV